MYAIYGNIYHQYTPNVSIYTIHGSYGIMSHDRLPSARGRNGPPDPPDPEGLLSVARAEGGDPWDSWWQMPCGFRINWRNVKKTMGKPWENIDLYSYNYRTMENIYIYIVDLVIWVLMYVYIYIYGWWFGTWILFSPIAGMMIQSDELIFFRGIQTTNQV